MNRRYKPLGRNTKAVQPVQPDFKQVLHSMQQRQSQMLEIIGQQDADLRNELAPILQAQQEDINGLYDAINLLPHFEGLTILDVLVNHERQIQQIFQLIGIHKLGYPPTPTDIPTEEIISTQSSAQRQQAMCAPDMSDTPVVEQLFQSQDFRRGVQIYNKPQLMKLYGVSESTIVRVKRLLRDQGFNI